MTCPTAGCEGRPRVLGWPDPNIFPTQNEIEIVVLCESCNKIYVYTYTFSGMQEESSLDEVERFK